jgi:uncharacterized protein YajQ (UPF0234 family)
MPTFDVVSKISYQELNNALSNCLREINTRYDFKGLNIAIEFKEKEKQIIILAPDNMKLKQINDLFTGHLVRRKIDPRIIKIKNVEDATGNSKRQTVDLQEGIDQESAKKIISQVKSSKIKVQVKIQGDELRVDGKKKDDLQDTMQLIRGIDIGRPVEFTNFRD